MYAEFLMSQPTLPMWKDYLKFSSGERDISLLNDLLWLRTGTAEGIF